MARRSSSYRYVTLGGDGVTYEAERKQPKQRKRVTGPQVVLGVLLLVLMGGLVASLSPGDPTVYPAIGVLLVLALVFVRAVARS